MSENMLENLEEENIPESGAIVYSGDQDKDITQEMETCYLNYAMSVIVQRALPDVRDGLKPVHRRILYAMHESGLRSTAKYRKSARVVGDVLGKYHPHGDTAVYDSMVRMAQYFSLRYPLIDGQGNFGSMDGDAAAAMRYTEAKMSKISDMMLADIDKETVDWKDNYDASCQEPKVLPSRIPNLLLNGVMGIAVGMATNIPPHNLGELIEAILFILHHPNKSEITIEDLTNFVKGPDFPTGGVIYNKQDIINAYATGRGSIVLRGKAHIDELKSGKKAIIVTEVPYQMNKANFIIKLADLVKEKIIVGISEIRDESSKELVRVVIEMKKDAFPKKILNQIYKLTGLQTSFAFNMIALHENGLQPKLFNLLEILEEFIEHRREVVTRRTIYELKIAEERAHILEGLKIALDNIDEVIATIKKSKTREDARENLMSKFGLSERQSQAILEMQLQKLSGLERQKIEDELAEKLLLIADLKDILSKPARIDLIVGDELKEIKDKYADARKTEVIPGKIGEFNAKDTIPNEDIVITLTQKSYIKRMKSSIFRTQRRGGRGVSNAVKDEDEVKIVISTRNHNDLLFFTDKGRVFRLPAYEIPETSRIAKGQPIINLLALQKGEEIASILDITDNECTNLVLATRKATVKRLDIKEISNIRTNGLIVMKTKEDDNLGWVQTTSGKDKIVMISKKGKVIQFDEEDVRVMGRAANGVRGLRLGTDDIVIETKVVRSDDKYLITITENGLGKIADLNEYREQGRGGKGIKVGKITPKTGDVIGAEILKQEDIENDELLLISKNGQTIRINMKSIRITGRVAQGVILAKLQDKKDSFVNFSIIKEGEKEETGEIEEEDSEEEVE